MVAGGLVGWFLFCFSAVRIVCKKVKRLCPQTPENAVDIPPPIMHNESNYDEIGVGPAFLYLMTSHTQSNLGVQKDSE